MVPTCTTLQLSTSNTAAAPRLVRVRVRVRSRLDTSTYRNTGSNSGGTDAGICCHTNDVPAPTTPQTVQDGYKGHVLNLPQDVAKFVNMLPHLPRDLDVLIIQKEGAAQSHLDFRDHCSRTKSLARATPANTHSGSSLTML